MKYICVEKVPGDYREAIVEKGKVTELLHSSFNVVVMQGR